MGDIRIEVEMKWRDNETRRFVFTLRAPEAQLLSREQIMALIEKGLAEVLG